MIDRISISTAENGYIVDVCTKGEAKSSKECAPYKEKRHVAPTETDALRIVSKALASGGSLKSKPAKKLKKKMKR